MTETVIDLRIIGVPGTQGSKTAGLRKDGSPFVRDASTGTRPWRYCVRQAVIDCEQQELLPWTGPVRLVIVFYLKRPVEHYRTGKGMLPRSVLKENFVHVQPAVRPDIDKIARSTLDGLIEGGLYFDDSQVVELMAVKSYADRLPVSATVRARLLGDRQVKGE